MSPLDQEPKIEALRKSGARIQQCFNILGMERDEKDPSKWKQRQVAAYHSFDVSNGNVFWIVMKGNATMQRRMQQAADTSLASNSHFPKSTHGSLRQALQEHLLLLRWGTENWVQYLDSLEKTCLRYTKITRYRNIQGLVDDTPIRRIRHWSTVSEAQPKPILKRPSTLNTARRQALLFIEPAVRRASHAIPNLSRGDTGLSAQTQKMQLNDEKLELDDLVSFEGLQSLNSVIGELHAAASVIDQNKRVITDIRDRYVELGESALLEMHLQNEEFKRCGNAINDFVRQIRHFEGDLDSIQGRLRVILHRAEQGSEMVRPFCIPIYLLDDGRKGRRELVRIADCFFVYKFQYNHIFQARNTRVAEFMARAAQDSAESMQKCTEEMHLKTISMHVITIFTLIFLPGTFVAVCNVDLSSVFQSALLIPYEIQTMFSSGIIVFGTEGSSGFGPNLGDWKVRTAGIKLFFIICLPLLACTLGLWFFAYVYARMKSSVGRLFKASEKQELPK